MLVYLAAEKLQKIFINVCCSSVNKAVDKLTAKDYEQNKQKKL